MIIGEADIGHGEAGDGLAAQFQRRVDRRCFGHRLHTFDALSFAAVTTPGAYLRHVGIEQLLSCGALRPVNTDCRQR